MDSCQLKPKTRIPKNQEPKYKNQNCPFIETRCPPPPLLVSDLWFLFNKLAHFGLFYQDFFLLLCQVGPTDPAHLLVRLTKGRAELVQVWIKSGRAQLLARGWSGITCSGRRQPNYKIGAGRQKGACWYLHRFQSINSLSSSPRPVWWLQFNAITSPTDHKF